MHIGKQQMVSMTVSECGPSSDPEAGAQLQKDAYNTPKSVSQVWSLVPQRLCKQRGLDSSIFAFGSPVSWGMAGHMLRCPGLTALTALHVSPGSCQPLCQTVLSLSVA